ncbi:MAG: hypothetical protein MUC89_01265 [Acetobacteraceae bacterium]|nr:hypothetical protein [Acetobacteraceae bacterium]
MPVPSAWPPGCRFHPRCAVADAACSAAAPPLVSVAPDHAAACIRPFAA